ncbi:hypothetical protein [Burkholderia pseudomallei]|uniref:hypothetical protein n=1 Tax=Burkholderia pseudomallei TaxID=28450 RepID=UPI00014F866D|nr:hypothetical protein [Burkholderia pseudomallei]AGR71780.1 hypothetical protein BDL_3043 [Burkholderia pseudomallei MSHR305]AHK64632.1 hypothetical protein BBX_1444 [Burkholderia pseudomallei MSHR520]AIP80093.1 hypothetical protein JE55_580 [Burkholderia pseudomallei]APZ19436.1 hypothetical protein BGI47_12735 [Burkholderia pseudomallei]APZ25629.1 hypothetical protein BGI46_12745 [Burkholderia pseudomallei]
MSGRSFSLRVDTSKLEASFDDHVQRQLPFAISKTLNDTAQAAKAALADTMREVFDRPTPYTMRSLRIRSATKQRLEARVGFIDESFKGTPATTYLMPQVSGGPRSVKRVEVLLRARGLLPSDMYVVPGAAAQLDQYGNFSRGQYSKILAQLQASRDRTQNETVRSRQRRKRDPLRDARYFVGRPGGGKMPLGVWARYQFAAGYAVRPVLMFVRAPRYGVRFPFDRIVETASARTLPTAFDAALTLAMSTRRR